MEDAELCFLSALFEATKRKLIKWSLVDDDDRDVYRANVGSCVIEVEFLYVPIDSTSGRSSERLFVLVSGLDVYLCSAIGTETYRVVQEMLSLQIFGWAEGRTGGLKALTKATNQIMEFMANCP